MKYLITIIICFQITLVQRVFAQETNEHKNVQNLITRVFSNYAGQFEFKTTFQSDSLDAFQINAKNGSITIFANTTTAFTRGIYHYIRNACNLQFTWTSTSLKLPKVLPDYTSGKITTPYLFRLYYNVCTFGYSTAFWDWPRWERELDWMALHGMNMPLAMNGQEAIWQKVWNSYGITNGMLQEYFTGPAFLPWHRMGNINKHAGPLPQNWIDQNKELQKKIIERMRELGMKPVVPAFSGFVPAAFAEIFKHEKIIKLAPWTGFGAEYGTYILSPQSSFFKEIGKKFIEEYKKEYGEVEYYLADSFNELQVPVTEQNRYSELAEYGNAVYESIKAGDENGIWVMQGWLFYNASDFWDKQSVSALLSKIPNDKMIIIDLANEYFEGWKQHDAFYGKKWIYSIIHNFGGSTKLFGKLDFLAVNPSQALNNMDKGKLTGFGISPEGIENNEVIYELLSDAAWDHNPIEINSWLQNYCLSRYGTDSKDLVNAWSLLNKNLYKSFSLTNIFLLQRRPSLSIRHSNVDPKELYSAAKLFLEADSLKDNVLYRNDMIDIFANLCGYKLDKILRQIIQKHKLGEIGERNIAFHQARRLASQLDDLLNFQYSKKLETWINDSRQWGMTTAEKNFYESNAKRQVTVWGGPYLTEYAAKLWSGLVKDYYFARWEKFYDSLSAGNTINLFEWEENWINTPYTRKITRDIDLINLAREILTDIEKINSEESKSILKLTSDNSIEEKKLQQGIRTKYYEGVWETLPDYSKENSMIDTVLQSISISIAKRSDNFGLQFSGVLKITHPGKYTFSLESDDGSKLFLNGKELIDNDGLHASEEQLCEVELSSGFYNFRVDFFQRGGGMNLKLYFTTPTTFRQELPGDMLYNLQAAPN